MRIDDFSNPELVTIAVALLNGDADYIDREDIAIKVNDIAPGRFNWRKYPERIDLDTVGVALRDAKKPKNGALLTGSNVGGWMLSPAGLKWIKTIDIVTIRGAEPGKHRNFANLEAECQRMRNTSAYKLYTAGQSEKISLQDFYQF